jgi:hypothetical protein
VRSRDGLTSYCKGCLAIKRAETRKRHPRPKAPDLRQCVVCKKSYSLSDARKTKYCSDDCFQRRRERPPVIELRTCVGMDCGKTFEASSHTQVRKRYCSQECYDQTKSQTKKLRVVACRWCQQPFTRAERGALEMFCSDACTRAKRTADKRMAGKRCTAKSVRATCDSCGLWFRRQPDSQITTCRDPVWGGTRQVFDVETVNAIAKGPADHDDDLDIAQGLANLAHEELLVFAARTRTPS